MKRSLLIFTMMMTCLAADAAFAGKFNSVLNIGDKAPSWQGLTGVDDKQYALADFADAKAVVVVFSCNHCPVASGYQDRLIALQKELAPQGVRLVAISVSSSPADNLAAMKTRAKSKGYNFPYLYDSAQKSGTSYGAAVTPHAFVLDKDRKVVYMGAIDDDQDGKDVERRYVREAVVAALAGKTPEVTETRPVGCGIEYQNVK